MTKLYTRQPFEKGHLKRGGNLYHLRAYLCTLCGAQYESMSGKTKFCASCRKVTLSKRNTEAKRRWRKRNGGEK